MTLMNGANDLPEKVLALKERRAGKHGGPYSKNCHVQTVLDAKISMAFCRRR